MNEREAWKVERGVWRVAWWAWSPGEAGRRGQTGNEKGGGRKETDRVLGEEAGVQPSPEPDEGNSDVPVPRTSPPGSSDLEELYFSSSERSSFSRATRALYVALASISSASWAARASLLRNSSELSRSRGTLGNERRSERVNEATSVSGKDPEETFTNIGKLTWLEILLFMLAIDLTANCCICEVFCGADKERMLMNGRQLMVAWRHAAALSCLRSHGL
ncbi:hypothetical protein EYF80_030651 [Liparis tanakae]|uniref:Uncharacterized protein n=1 Tax=Liparis tanakae TaxID=230148 RepID=A0A4Z2GZR5_9TELE|nr:hypothetical protein EYF80_030651 [Liparis tanakae]